MSDILNQCKELIIGKLIFFLLCLDSFTWNFKGLDRKTCSHSVQNSLLHGSAEICKAYE